MIEPSIRWRRLSRGILAAYRVLRPVLGRNRAMTLLQSILARRLRHDMPAYLENRFGIRTDAPEGAFDAVSVNFVGRGKRMFGAGFEFEHTLRDETRSFFEVRTCFFHDYFTARDAPELTAVFCTLDTVWIDELADPRYGIRFERPATLADGADACSFCFYRAGPAIPADPIANRDGAT
jgi:hypothetical protein